MSNLFKGAFAGKRVLVTGHTGFKGSWLCLWLRQLGAEVTGFSLAPPSTPNNFEASAIASGLAHHVHGDVRDLDLLTRVVAEVDPDLVFHLAALSVVRASYRDPIPTLATNVMGTANVLEAVRLRAKPCAVVVITSDKCYENRGWLYGYRETDELGGHDPYSMSKGAAELVVSSWRRSFFGPDAVEALPIRVATARAGNVFGGGDWQQDRIVVDCMRALQAGSPVDVRNPSATRPWQHVLEPLGGYLLLASRLLAPAPPGEDLLADAWNFGPEPSSWWTVSHLVEEFIRQWGTGSWNDRSQAHTFHEAGFLTVCCDKAMHLLGWRPVWDVNRAIVETVDWYRAFGRNADMGAMCRAQIEAYVSDAAAQPLSWTR